MSLKLTIYKVQPERKQITRRYNILCMGLLNRSSVSRARVFMIQRFVTKKLRLIAKTEVISTLSLVSLFHPVIRFVWRSSVTRKILTRLH